MILSFHLPTSNRNKAMFALFIIELTNISRFCRLGLLCVLSSSSMAIIGFMLLLQMRKSTDLPLIFENAPLQFCPFIS